MDQTGEQQQVELGPGGVPKGAKTSDYYRTFDIPERFDKPGGCYIPGNPVFSCQIDLECKKVDNRQTESDSFQGYSDKTSLHPLYRQTSKDYGARPPTVHTVPTIFRGRSQKFSGHLGVCGMYKNNSLNTYIDEKKC